VSGGTAVDVRLREPPRSDAPPPRRWDVTHVLFAVVGIGGLIAASFWVLRPFLPAVIWATMIVVATWPALRGLETLLWRRRGLAVAVMTLLILAVLAVPLTLATMTIVERVDDVVAWSRSLLTHPLPALPGWIERIPFAGKKIAAEWDVLARAPSEELAARIGPHVQDIARWSLAQAGSIGTLIVQFLLTAGICAILYAQGEAVVYGVLAFARRLAGDEGVRAVYLSGGAIRAVALGIVVTALVQGAFGGIGLALTGVPHALLLTCLMIMFGVVQIGPAPVLLGGVIWLYGDGRTYAGTILIAWGLLAMSFDNILRPLLIRKGADLPLLLIIAGVIGGLLAFGLVGLFMGPVILAVAYTLLLAWVRAGEPATAAARAAADS
jgi:predicted PurR-regulated permease PerM